MSSTVLITLQLVTSVLLTVTVLLQNSSQGAGLFDGSMGGGESFRTKRGLEKFLFYLTIVLALIMIGLSFVIYMQSGQEL